MRRRQEWLHQRAQNQGSIELRPKPQCEFGLPTDRPHPPVLGFSPTAAHETARIRWVAEVDLFADFVARLHVRLGLSQGHYVLKVTLAGILGPHPRRNGGWGLIRRMLRRCRSRQ